MRQGRESPVYGAFVNDPHPKSRLAYLAQGVRILMAHDDQAPEWERSADLRTSMAQKLCRNVVADLRAAGLLSDDASATLPAPVEALVEKIGADRLHLTIAGLEMWKARHETPPTKQPRQPKADQPLMPHQSIVGLLCLEQRQFSRTKSESAFYDEMANFLNAGIPQDDMKAGLEAHHIRRAFAGWSDKRLEDQERCQRRIRKHGTRRPWERSLYESLLCIDDLEKYAAANFMLDMRITLLRFFYFEPLHALLYLENQAKSDNRVRDLKGAELALRIDDLSGGGLAACVERRVNEVVAREQAA